MSRVGRSIFILKNCKNSNVLKQLGTLKGFRSAVLLFSREHDRLVAIPPLVAFFSIAMVSTVSETVFLVLKYIFTELEFSGLIFQLKYTNLLLLRLRWNADDIFGTTIFFYRLHKKRERKILSAIYNFFNRCNINDHE